MKAPTSENHEPLRMPDDWEERYKALSPLDATLLWEAWNDLRTTITERRRAAQRAAAQQRRVRERTIRLEQRQAAIAARRRERASRSAVRRAFCNPVRLDAPISAGRNGDDWSRHDFIGGNEWEDPAFESLTARLEDEWEQMRAEVWAWNLEHQQPRFRPIDTTDDTQVPTAGNGLVHRLSSQHRGRNAQKALMAGKRIAQKPRSKR